MKNVLVCIALFMGVGLAVLWGQKSQNYVIKNVTLVDGRSPSQPGMDVVIAKGVIAAIKATGASYPDSMEVMDYSGHFLIPGLIDSHVHLGMLGIFERPERARQEFRKWVYSGVTSVREMGGDARHANYEQLRISRGDQPGPDIYFSVTYGSTDMLKKDIRLQKATLGIPLSKAAWIQEAKPNMDIMKSVILAKGTQATGIKFYAGIPADLIALISEEAHRQGLRTWAHLTVFPDRPLEVVRSGIDVVSHTWGAFWQDPDVDPSLRVPFTHTSFKDAQHAIFPSKMSVVNADEPEVEALLKEMAKRNIIWDATYSIGDSLIRSHFRPFLQKGVKYGVKLAAGTDWYNSPMEPFPSLFIELELLVAEGILTPSEALEAATYTGARALGIENSHGSLEVGKVANLVILSENPATDIKAIRSVKVTVKNGKLFPREDYFDK